MYTITFTDNTTYQGGQDLTNTGWNDMPSKPITRIEYTLSNQKIVMKNKESYNHLVESIFARGITTLTQVILIGKTGEKVDCMYFNLKTNRWNRQILQYGKEYNGGSTIGWKAGI